MWAPGRWGLRGNGRGPGRAAESRYWGRNGGGGQGARGGRCVRGARGAGLGITHAEYASPTSRAMIWRIESRLAMSLSSAASRLTMCGWQQHCRRAVSAAMARGAALRGQPRRRSQPARCGGGPRRGGEGTSERACLRERASCMAIFGRACSRGGWHEREAQQRSGAGMLGVLLGASRKALRGRLLHHWANPCYRQRPLLPRPPPPITPTPPQPPPNPHSKAPTHTTTHAHTRTLHTHTPPRPHLSLLASSDLDMAAGAEACCCLRAWSACLRGRDRGAGQAGAMGYTYAHAGAAGGGDGLDVCCGCGGRVGGGDRHVKGQYYEERGGGA